MKKNDIVKGICDSVGYNGEGILHIEGTTVFVPFVLSGESVTVKILKVDKNIAYGKLLSVDKESEDRVTPPCKYFTKCGGCQLQHVKYNKQLDIKKSIVENCFYKIANLSVKVDNICGEDEYEYRNKLQLPVRDCDGVKKLGFFRENSHDIVEVDDCVIQPKWAKTIIKILKGYINGDISCYNDKTKKGLLRHFVVRELNGEFIVTAVVNGKVLPNSKELYDKLTKEFDKVSLYLNINTFDNNVILGDKFILLYGKGQIDLKEFDIKYSIGPASFLQVNTNMKIKLYQKALEFVAPDKDTIVIDGYSGAGVMTGIMAKNSKMAYGVEIVKEAVDSADKLAKDNNLNMQNICAPCEDVLPDLIGKVNGKTVLLLDPPRKGVDSKIIDAILKAKPDKIVYISCSPQTLARDVGLLVGSLKLDEKGIKKADNIDGIYKLERVELFDLFPQTKHVETVVLLSHKKLKFIKAGGNL